MQNAVLFSILGVMCRNACVFVCLYKSGSPTCPLTVEAPAGVGFSYSEHPNGYHTDDNITALDNYKFLVNWFKAYPEYKKNDFYVRYVFCCQCTLVDWLGVQVLGLADMCLLVERNTNIL